MRRLLNLVGIGLITVLAVVAVVPIVSVVVDIYMKGIAAIGRLGGLWTFLTDIPPSPTATAGGVGSQLVGSLFMTALGAAVGILIGFPVGVYIGEYRRETLAHLSRGVVQTLVEFPTLAVGLFVASLFGLMRTEVNQIAAPVSERLAAALGDWVTYFVGELGPYNAYIGAAALGLVMMPYVALFTASSYASIVQPLREAAYSISSSEFGAVFVVLRKVVWRAVLTSFLLGTAKIAGETAPLLLTAFGNRYYAPFTGQTGAVSLWIYSAALQPYQVQVDSAYGAAAVLLTVVLTIFIVAKAVGRHV